MEKRIEDLDISQELLGLFQIPKPIKFGLQKENILFKYNTELQHLLQLCLCMTGMGLFYGQILLTVKLKLIFYSFIYNIIRIINRYSLTIRLNSTDFSSENHIPKLLPYHF